MKLFTRGTMLASMLLLAVTAGCVDDQTQKEDAKPDKTAVAEETTVAEETKVTEEMTEEKIPPAGRTVEDMVSQKAGVLIEKYMDQHLETLGGWDSQQYSSFLKETFYPIADKEIAVSYTHLTLPTMAVV